MRNVISSLMTMSSAQNDAENLIKRNEILHLIRETKCTMRYCYWKRSKHEF